MELFKANDQWMTRPDDQRFSTVAEMAKACNGYRKTASEGVVRQGDLRVVATPTGLGLLNGAIKGGRPAVLTNWAFGQLASRMAAPANYLRTLSPELAATNLNYCLKDDACDDKEMSLLLHDDADSYMARAFTTDRYARIWNGDVCDRLIALPGGWKVPPARPARDGQAGTRIATKADVIAAGAHGLSVKAGDAIAPAGLYASDHDMFAFMINEDLRIKDGSKEGLSRGFFCWNSEVGASSFGLMSFLYKSVCGNHIVWGASEVTKIRIRHVGQANAKAFGQLEGEVIRYAEASASEDEARIKSARKLKLGDDKDAVLDAIFKLGIAGLGRDTADAAYDTAEQLRADYGDPRTVWAIANGITHNSQDSTYAAERVMLDRAAGRLLEATITV